MNLKRLHPRILWPQPVCCSSKQNPCFLGEWIDFSETGARIRILSRQALGKTLRLYWTPVPSLVIPLEGRILWRKKSLVGIAFQKLSAQQQALLKAYVRYHRSEEA